MESYRVMNTFDYLSENKIVNEYLITVNETDDGCEEYVLSRTHEEIWDSSVRGQEILRIIDTGDGYISPKRIFAKDVDYAIFAELFILMNFINKTSFTPIYKGTIEKIDKIIEI